MLVADIEQAALQELLQRYDLRLVVQAEAEPITASYWGDSEAGIVGHKVFVRPDTPIHSVLHESCHTICMNAERRARLDGDAGGDDVEEAAVCYLQILLAQRLEGVGSERLMRDMDAWGYSFRRGSSRQWFTEDAEDARKWLIEKGLLTSTGQPLFRLRQ